MHTYQKVVVQTCVYIYTYTGILHFFLLKKKTLFAFDPFTSIEMVHPGCQNMWPSLFSLLAFRTSRCTTQREPSRSKAPLKAAAGPSWRSWRRSGKPTRTTSQPWMWVCVKTNVHPVICRVCSSGFLLTQLSAFFLPPTPATDSPYAGTQPERSGSLPVLLQHASTAARKRNRFCPLRLLRGKSLPGLHLRIYFHSLKEKKTNCWCQHRHLCLMSARPGSRAGDGPRVHPSAGSRCHHWKERTAHQAAEPLCRRLHQGMRHI